MISLGIESTAHTFGIGIVDDKKILANCKDVYQPKHGSGIHPSECREHHDKVKENVLEEALKESNLEIKDVDIVSYSAGPGLPPCLKIGYEFAFHLAESKRLVPVNHCIAHIEIGRLVCKTENPVVLYVSGGNTQVISLTEGRYRIFGETMDIAIGNAIDVFIRETCGQYPGGPVLEELAKNGNYIELPYAVKGMDLSFTGLTTACIEKYKKGVNINDIAFSFQETAYAMLTEVSERAVAHTGKNEVLMTGGVAASLRLRQMMGIMCEERGAKFFACPREFSGDNGAMIAYTGILFKDKKSEIKDFRQKWRTDDVDL